MKPTPFGDSAREVGSKPRFIHSRAGSLAFGASSIGSRADQGRGPCGRPRSRSKRYHTLLRRREPRKVVGEKLNATSQDLLQGRRPALSLALGAPDHVNAVLVPDHPGPHAELADRVLRSPRSARQDRKHPGPAEGRRLNSAAGSATWKRDVDPTLAACFSVVVPAGSGSGFEGSCPSNLRAAVAGQVSEGRNHPVASPDNLARLHTSSMKRPEIV